MHSVGGTLGSMYDSLSAPPTGPSPKPRKERKFSLLLRRTSDPLHCAGIESLALAPDGSTVYTASRDATVRSWSAASPAGQWQATFEGHSNWVNDVIAVENSIVSCSSDCTIAVWSNRARGVSRAECTLHKHTDYVTCLAAAKDLPVILSGGLRGQVLLWDLPTAVSSTLQGQSFRCIDQGSSLGSVYALDINARGNTIAVGSPEGLIRISDARTASKSFKLRGHTDNVRDILLNSDGTLCLSASSDHTIRLWDLGQQRCVQTFAVHTDSVWTLQATPDFSLIYSGGRDHSVYRTHVSLRSSELLFQEKGPVNKLAMGLEGQLWCATTSSDVRCWQIPAAEWGCGGHLPPASPRTPSRHSGRVFHAGASPQVRQRLGSRLEPSESKVQTEIEGIPPLIRFAILTDRRHVLTQDSAGFVALWDITCGAITKQYGKVDMAEKEKELFAAESIHSWFTADVKLGSLSIHLETPSCFAAEVYATELGREDSPDDLKYNYGENMLKAALEQWVKGLAASYVASGSANGAGPAELAGASSCFQLQVGVPPLIMGQRQSDSNPTELYPWTKATDELDGTEKAGEVIPKWVAEAVLYNRYPLPPELKCAFLLIAAEGSGLPSLLQNRLNAPRILKIGKVAVYVVGKLADEGLQLEPRKLYRNPQWQAQLETQRRESGASAGSPVAQELEFVCNGQAVPFDLSLAAVRSFIWRRSDPLTIHFRVFNPLKPAPLPLIKPP